MAEEKKNSKAGCLGIFVLSVFVVLAMRVCSSGDSSDDGESMALVMSRNFVRDKLVSPSTAEFASLSSSTVTKSGNSFHIISYVDAKDAFGTPIRKNYTCLLSHSPNTKNWSLISLDIE